jgi:hypothetical protein
LDSHDGGGSDHDDDDDDVDDVVVDNKSKSRQWGQSRAAVATPV